MGTFCFNSSNQTLCACGTLPGMKIGFSLAPRRRVSLIVQASLEGDCLEIGDRTVMTQIPQTRLTRAGKGTTFRRTQKMGRTRSSVCKRPAAQQSPPLRRCHGNPNSTWLWIGSVRGWCTRYNATRRKGDRAQWIGFSRMMRGIRAKTERRCIEFFTRSLQLLA